ncbi:MAG: flp pilus-assembly TadE/G-like family protein [Schaalia sp.]|nr:flp pilus-assembly TadE/G-like family protein [Schaalia sp.]
MYRAEPVTYGRAGTRSDEEGSGTINSVGLIVLALVLGVLLSGVGVAHRERVRLQAVADLAALAGAEQSATADWEDVWERPCRAASAVAGANGVGVQSCEVRDLDCLVVLTQSVNIAGISTNVSARARAGPER